MQGIYCIEHIESKRKYYGSSINVNKRLASHKRALKNQTHHNVQLQRAFDKYGIYAFLFYLVEETSFSTHDELLSYEQSFLDTNTGGYNMAPANGGDCLSQHPNKDEIRTRIRNSHAKTISKMTLEEKREKYGRSGDKNPNWRDGGASFKICPECNISKISSTSARCRKCQDRTGRKNPFYGKTHTENTKQRLREAMSGENSWIRGIDPAKLPYTNHYEVIYPNCSVKQIAGLKAIASEFNVTIENIHATIKRVAAGKIPTRGKLAGVSIKKL